ncbi:rod shape-determining protein [candidate division WOR-3 bacterium JGI_Cruoil_03_44_89]|mgnify:CR=1 FL=1|uniref:Cell shape-determining protein MreB n=1 Tax=candidate division WOR-3 bacterium JGI_Cruoil_03_44_89 TaxID=1973748 RepID=A0A235BW62_UNCW3|nr:MAG: rod shape-determining protein [candidate division WOR-3 bacterium JGI_Cruoil_03_44_89]
MKWFIGNDIGIDLGTATTLIYIKGKGIVLNEPTVVAIEKSTKKSIAIGLEAKRMLGRTPESISAIRPMKDGVIADFEMVEELIRVLLSKVQARRLFIRPRVVVSVPSGITAVERRAVRDSIEHAGAREVYLVSEPLAAAIGVGLPIEAPSGNMVIDIGGGTTEIAVIALSGIVTNVSVRVAGDEMNDAIVQYLKKRYNLLIGESTAEEVKITIGSALPSSAEEETQVKGIDLVAGLPRIVKVNSEETRSALHEPLGRIITAVRDSLEKTPPELASDIVESGIVMTGGGSLLRGIPEIISKETGLPVKLAENPVECVVKGTGKILDSFEHYYKILSKGGRER